MKEIELNDGFNIELRNDSKAHILNLIQYYKRRKLIKIVLIDTINKVDYIWNGYKDYITIMSLGCVNEHKICLCNFNKKYKKEQMVISSPIESKYLNFVIGCECIRIQFKK